MKISNNPNVSFKAQFVMKINPMVIGNPTQDKFEKAVDNAPKKTINLLKFLGFIQSKEGSEILNKLPENDIIRLESPFFINDETNKPTVEPYLIYEPSGVTEAEKNKIAFALPDFRAEGAFMDASRKIAPQFKKWVNDLVEVRKEVLNNK